jgi:SagB-type dehydrogenase family enzyme
MDSHENIKDLFQKNRFFLKDNIRQLIDFSVTDQRSGLSAPPLQKPAQTNALRIDLPDGSSALTELCSMDVGKAILQRESVRSYTQKALTLKELSALLWSAQGVRRVLSPTCAFRTVPSAGSRHAFETYLAVSNVEGLQPGLYRYLPFDGQLIQLRVDDRMGVKASLACLDQHFVASAAVTLFWTVIPARVEWRYHLAAHKVIAIDAGHVCQNLYLACTALNAGTCAIAAYDQEACDQLLGVDGEEEFTLYIAPVGKVQV